MIFYSILFISQLAQPWLGLGDCDVEIFVVENHGINTTDCSDNLQEKPADYGHGTDHCEDLIPPETGHCKQFDCSDGNEDPSLRAETFAAGVGGVSVVLSRSSAHTQTQKDQSNPVEHVLRRNSKDVFQTKTVQFVHLE